MIVYETYALLRPWWLLALPIAALVAFLAWRRGRSLGAWERAVDGPLLAAMERIGHVRRKGGRWLPPLPLLAALPLILGLAGPALRGEAPAFRNLNGIVLVFDLSPSVTRGGRLGDAQAAAALALEQSGGRPVALILYSGEPYLVSAFTTDPSSPESLIGVLDPETMPDGGSRPDKALNLAGDLLAEAKINRSDVVLISDGGGLDKASDDAVDRIVAAGGHVSTVYVAPDTLPPESPPPHPEALEALAKRGEGTATAASEPESLVAALKDSEASLIEAGLTPLYFRDFGPWLVALSLVPAGLMFRRRS
ncbi:hypothetical protein HDIA_1033 [Hartmannibacter diazotrophicus]|uniref:VWFA domain-containing protein n=1 Tax=Hartmannibacter diazotrophicus TaxID=1482074 RepID=A0A2C9D2T5_9HYPH|nr:vWA domain-containing protein [Hartmannibacter diazotrophicus]SON54574.1 hypothetical protein HDIA_1033 [Hartmannibacter diazotrophicus]